MAMWLESPVRDRRLELLDGLANSTAPKTAQATGVTGKPNQRPPEPPGFRGQGALEHQASSIVGSRWQPVRAQLKRPAREGLATKGKGSVQGRIPGEQGGWEKCG